MVLLDANVCPICDRKDPLFLRYPKCRSPVNKGWKACSNCGLKLVTVCPKCGKIAFLVIIVSAAKEN
ncbi:double zinc ribbon domain-containing protein [Geosporobacter subterraneus]|uniref:double zinc ribbon domain-containing protein n=1 Tax=Geosporobacter subterraneus TaxID=390806 RepID=UPI0038B9EA84